MASLKIYTHKSARGITLIEIIIVVGLTALLASLGLIMSLGDYRAYSFRTERDLLVATLERARAQSQSNLCARSTCTGGITHGVHISLAADGSVQSYVLFEGSIYDPQDPLNSDIGVGSQIGRRLHASGLSGISFEPLSGDVTSPGTILLSDMQASSTITIGNEGQISWTN